MEKDTSLPNSTNTSSLTCPSVNKSSDGKSVIAVGSSFSVLSKLENLVRKSLDLSSVGQTYEHGDDHRPAIYLTSVEYLDSGMKYITLSTCSSDDALFYQKHFKLAGCCTNEYEHGVRLDFVESILSEQGIKIVRGVKKI